MAHSSAREYPWSRLDTDNLTGLAELSEKALLSATKKRYSANMIYTDVGDILVAVNPFQELPIYDEAWSTAYCCPDVSSLSPHIYRVAARAFNAMVQGKKDQVCVISGESGAGKTESAKFIMYQVMKMCRSAGLGRELQEKITQLNPILEAFGNASTALNDNSSRFGKYIQLIFDPNGRIVGAGLEQYLLEKSRVCVQGDMERNFHIFYYLYAGLPEEKLKKLQLKAPTDHRYLKNHPNVLQDCSSESSKKAFESVIGGMLNVGFEEDEVVSVVSLLAGVILIGDIEFRGADGGEDNSRVRNRLLARAAAQALEIESVGELCFALTTLRTETRGEQVDKKYTCTKAADVRDALAKAVYARMFQWIVTRLNGHLQPFATSDQLNIGILDIFGFENLEPVRHNSFEQFCINLANEQLQCYFNHQIFAMEKMELEKEGIDVLEIRFTDNKPVLDLYLTRPIGLLSLLDEQCRGFNGTERAFVHRCKESFGSHANYLPHKGNALLFSIRHYAGDVKYVAEGFLEKNKDTLPDTLVDAVKNSSMRLLRTLFRRSSSDSMLRRSTLRKNQKSMIRSMSGRKSLKSRGGGQKKLLTVSAHFRQNLDLLMERVFSASPHFVRCIKPNREKKAFLCDDAFMLKQLRYTGMVEAVRVRREGYAYRPYFSDFFNGYRGLAFLYTDAKIKGTVAACSEILNKAGLTGWRMGQSRVFLRYYHKETLQLMLKDMDDKAILIQKAVRGFLARKWTELIRKTQKNERLYLSGFMLQISRYRNVFQPRLMEMNRIDILSAKERFGHLSRIPTVSASSSSRGIEGISARDKNLKKAQAFGVQLVPTFKVPPPPTQPASKKKTEVQVRTSIPRQNLQQPNGHAQASLTGDKDISSSCQADRADRFRALAQVSIQQEQPNNGGNELSSPFYRPSYKDRHKAFTDLQASLHIQQSATKDPAEAYSRARSRSYGDRNRISAHTSSKPQEQQNRDLVESFSRSTVVSNSSVVVAQPGASQLIQVGQNVFMMSLAEGESGLSSPAAKSTVRKQPPPRPAKSTGRSFFASRRAQKTTTKVSAQYEAVVQAEAKPEKKSSRFNFKLPFGRGRVKELKAKMEQSTNSTQAADKKVPHRPKISPPIVKPKSYLPVPQERAPPQKERATPLKERAPPPKERVPPPKERAPPPPSEPAPLPPTNSKVSPYRQRGAGSKPSPYHQGSKIPKSSPYHNETKKSNPSLHNPGTTESKAALYGQEGKESPKTSPYHGTKLPIAGNSPKHERTSSASKIPPPTVPKTYVSKYLPHRPQTSPSPTEVAAVNNSMSLYTCEEYLVPVRTQPQSVTISPSGEEESLPSPKSHLPVSNSTSNNLPQVQLSFTAKKLAASSTLSLESIAEEHEENSPSPPPAEPPSLLSPKQEDNPSSLKVVSPGVPRYNRLEPIASQTTQNSLSMPNAGSSKSLDSALQDYAPSTIRSQPSQETTPSTKKQNDTQLLSFISITGQSSLANSAASSMSLDSILEEFSKISSTEIGETQKSLFPNDVTDNSLPFDSSKTDTSENNDSNDSTTISNTDSTPTLVLRNKTKETKPSLDTTETEHPVSNSNKGTTPSPRYSRLEPLGKASVFDIEAGLETATSKTESPTSSSNSKRELTSAKVEIAATDESVTSKDEGEKIIKVATSKVETPVYSSNEERSLTSTNSKLTIRRESLISKTKGEASYSMATTNDLQSQQEINGDSIKLTSHQQPPIPKPRRKSRRRERLPSDSELTASVPAEISPNLVKLKVLANSEGNLVDDRELNPVSGLPSNTPKSTNDHASPVDQAFKAERKLLQKQKRRSKKDRFAIRRNSSNSESDDNGLSPAPSVESLSNVDWDVVLLGFYPHLNHHTVHEFIMGQPRGTYAIYKENLSDEQLNGSSNFGLAVSLGRRGIKQFTIISSTSEDNQVSYQLAKFPQEDSDSPDGQDKNENENLSFFELQTLIDYYKFSELSPGLLLRQPRLLAGVYVVGLMKASVSTTYKKKSDRPLLRPPVSTPVQPQKPNPTHASAVKPPVSLLNGPLPVNTSLYSSVYGNIPRSRTRKRREYEVVY